MKKKDVEKIIGAAKAGGAGIVTAAVFAIAANARRRKKERLEREKEARDEKGDSM